MKIRFANARESGFSSIDSKRPSIKNEKSKMHRTRRDDHAARPNTRRASFVVNNAHVRRRRRTAQNMSNWADDSGDLPPLSVPEAAPVPTPTPAPAPASSSGASAPAAPKASGYVPPHLRNRPASGGGGGDRGDRGGDRGGFGNFGTFLFLTRANRDDEDATNGPRTGWSEARARCGKKNEISRRREWVDACRGARRASTGEVVRIGDFLFHPNARSVGRDRRRWGPERDARGRGCLAGSGAIAGRVARGVDGFDGGVDLTNCDSTRK
jgi:hypothetical protein